jgi:hypothetical protein
MRRLKLVSGRFGGKTMIRPFAALAIVCAAATLGAQSGSAQHIDFGKIDKFELLLTGSVRVGEPRKTIVDDGARHVVILTIWRADAETKMYWKSDDGDDRTTVMPGGGVQTFQTSGELKLEALGKPDRRVDYGYGLLGVRK